MDKTLSVLRHQKSKYINDNGVQPLQGACDYVSKKLTKKLSIIVTTTLHISQKPLLSATMKTIVHIRTNTMKF